MGTLDDPFKPWAGAGAQQGRPSDAASRQSRPAPLGATAASTGATTGASTFSSTVASTAAPAVVLFPTIAVLHGFDLLEQPLLSGLPGCCGQLVAARSTVPLTHALSGRDVLVVFVDGDIGQPVITGVLQRPAVVESAPQEVAIQADGERHVISAEREIVLRCGQASITLTRAGKVVIKGAYILSRSTGYNKIKGAAVDIN